MIFIGNYMRLKMAPRRASGSQDPAEHVDKQTRQFSAAERHHAKASELFRQLNEDEQISIPGAATAVFHFSRASKLYKKAGSEDFKGAYTEKGDFLVSIGFPDNARKAYRKAGMGGIGRRREIDDRIAAIRKTIRDAHPVSAESDG